MKSFNARRNTIKAWLTRIEIDSKAGNYCTKIYDNMPEYIIKALRKLGYTIVLPYYIPKTFFRKEVYIYGKISWE